MSSKEYKTPDWRGALARNRRKSNFVLAGYFLIYGFLGFLLDLILFFYLFHPATSLRLPSVNSIAGYHYQGYSPVTRAFPGAWEFVKDAVLHYTHGVVFPYATVGALVLAFSCLVFALTRQNKLVLSGTKYKLLENIDNLDHKEKQLLNVVEEMLIAMNLPANPDVYVIDASYMNAFASGYNYKNSMIAITRPLLDALNRAELQAVIAHELSHIKHLDTRLLVSATVLTGLILITVDLLYEFSYRALFVSGRGGRKSNGKGGGANPILVIFLIMLVAKIVLPITNLLMLRFLSRKREFMADAGSVAAMRDNLPLGSALIKIHNAHATSPESVREYGAQANNKSRAASYIYSPQEFLSGAVSFSYGLFSTHPPLQERLAALNVDMPNKQ